MLPTSNKSTTLTILLSLMTLVFYTSIAWLTVFKPIIGSSLVIAALIAIFSLIHLKIIPPIKKFFFAVTKFFLLALFAFIPALVILGFLPEDYIQPTVLVLFILNIAEAVLFDLKNKNYYNMISGIALILFIPFFISVSWQNPYYLTHPNTLIFWMIAYTLWNWNFILFYFSSQETYHYAMVLLSPFVIVLLTQNIGIWLVARVITALLGGMGHVSLGKMYVIPHMRIPAWESFCTQLKSNPRWQGLYAVVTIGLIVASVFA